MHACQIVDSNNSEIISLRITLPKIEAKVPLKFSHSKILFLEHLDHRKHFQIGSELRKHIC